MVNLVIKYCHFRETAGFIRISLHNLPNGTVLIFSAVYRHPVAIVGATHSAGSVCTSQLNYLNITKKLASTLCRIWMHEQMNDERTWVFFEVFFVRNCNFLLVWIVCFLIHSFRLLVRLHLPHGNAFYSTVPFASIVR